MSPQVWSQMLLSYWRWRSSITFHLLLYHIGLLTLHLLRVRRLHHWSLIEYDTPAQDDLLVIWILNFVAFHTFLETYEHIFSRSRTQIVFLDMVIGRTTKYPKRVIVLSNFSWPYFQISFTSYHRWRQPVNEMASIRQCLSSKRFR